MSLPTGSSIWIKASVGVLNASGQPCANGQDIVTLKDQSGNGNDFTATGTSSGQLTFNSTLVNGRPLIYFNLSSSAYVISKSAVTPTYMFFLANVPSSQTVQWSVFAGLYGQGDSRYLSRTNATNVSKWQADFNDITTVTRANGTPTTGSNGPIFNNVFAQYTATPYSGTQYAGASGTVGLGNTNARPLIVYLSELLIYQGSLTTGQISQIENYLLAPPGSIPPDLLTMRAA